MVELMEKSETYKMEMARFQAKDLKEIFSQDCTQEMRGSKDNNTLFRTQSAIWLAESAVQKL